MQEPGKWRPGSTFIRILAYKRMKRCAICKKTKPEAEFNKHKHRRDGLQSHCKKCNQEKSRAYYTKNKNRHLVVIRARNKQQRKMLQQYIYDFLRKNPCVDCGESNPCCLDFDHLRDKKYNISRMAAQGLSLKTVTEEIAKCEVRCANCHRKRTAKTFRWYKNINHGPVA